MLCNDAQFKNMDQAKSLGQLYDVQILKRSSTKAIRLGLLIFYDKIIINYRPTGVFAQTK